MLRRWLGRRDVSSRIEERLRRERPEPTDELVDRLTRSVAPAQAGQAPWARRGVAVAIAAIALVAFAAFGGIGYAASGVSSTVSSITSVLKSSDNTAVNSPTPAVDQYGNECGLGDYVWIDANGNGIQDDGFANGVNGVLVELLDANTNAVLQTTTTHDDASGHPGYYLFSSLDCGTYKVRVAASNFTPPGVLVGMSPTTRFAGSDRAVDSNGDANSTSEAVTLPSGTIDLTIDFGYVPVICPPGAKFGGSFFTEFDAQGNLHIKFVQSTNFNDNSYGANAVGWGKKDHKFKDLTGSDNAEFVIRDATGKIVLQFKLDYLTCDDKKTGGTPSGCDTLGPTGGDGKIEKGQVAWILDWDTSLAQNLNDTGYCSGGTCVVDGTDLKVDSPKTVGPNDYTLLHPAAYPNGWEFANVYEATISKDAWGAAGFGSASTLEVHNSPSKEGATCVPGGGGLCSDKTKLASLTLEYTGEACQTPLPNPQSGKATCTGTLNGNDPVRIVVQTSDGKKTYYDSGTPASVHVGDQFDVTAASIGASSLGANTLVKIYDASGTLIQTVSFHTSCSQLIQIGDRFGAIEITGGTNTPK